MVNYREILRLHSLNHSQREIARASGSSRNTVSEVLRAAAEQKVTWPLDDDITDLDSDAAYDIQVKEYSRQMADLQHRQQELKEKSNQYAEAKYWLDEFKTHIHSGDYMNADDAIIMRSMVEKIIVFDDRIDIYLRCGINIVRKFETSIPLPQN